MCRVSYRMLTRLLANLCLLAIPKTVCLTLFGLYSNLPSTHSNTIQERPSPMISKGTYEVIKANADTLNSAIIYDRDFSYVRTGSLHASQRHCTNANHTQTYFGFKTLERSYLLRINGKVAERPQHMLMRVSVGIHGEDIEKAIETYNLVRLFIVYTRYRVT